MKTVIAPLFGWIVVLTIIGTLFILLTGCAAYAAPCPVLPTKITAPCSIAANGSYELAGNIDGTSGGSAPVIAIDPGVTLAVLNCNGYAIENNNTAYVSVSQGVYGLLIANITIRNCRFTGTGLAKCVEVRNAGQGRVYKHITLENNTCSATSQGFDIDSDDFTAFGNYIANIGGHANCYSGARTYGIQIVGDAPIISGNKIRRIWNRCFVEAVAVSFTDLAMNAALTDNEIENDIAIYIVHFAVWVGPNGSYTFAGNKINTWGQGILGYSPAAASALSGSSLITNTILPLGPTVVAPLWTVTP